MAQTTINSIPQLKNSIETINGFISEYRAQVDQLMATVEKIDSEWDDEASEQFVNIIKTDRAKFDALEAMLKDYMIRLEEIIAEYQASEARALELVNAMR